MVWLLLHMLENKSEQGFVSTSVADAMIEPEAMLGQKTKPVQNGM